MNHLFNITRKELKELLTPGSIISIVLMMVMLMSVGLLVGEEIGEDGVGGMNLSPIGIVNGDTGGVYSGYAIEIVEGIYTESGVEAEDLGRYVLILDSAYGDDEAIVREMSERGLSSVISIAPDFSDKISVGERGSISSYYIFSGAGIFSNLSSEIGVVMLSFINTGMSSILIGENIDDPSPDVAFLQNPVDYSLEYTSVGGTVHAGVNPYQISGALMSQTMTVPIIIMIIIVMIGSIVISSMGNEKENKTLETLLTLPVKRTTIVSGKLIASAIVGLVFGIMYMIGMSFYMNSMTASVGGMDLSELGLSLSVFDWMLMGVMIFLTIMSALGMCMIMGAFVKNYKSAQMMTFPISLLAMIPMFITMFIGWDSLPAVGQAVLFAIPFTHPMMGMTNLMFGDDLLVIAGIAYLLIFSLTMIYLTVRLYKSDILLTGLGSTRLMRSLKKAKSRR